MFMEIQVPKFANPNLTILVYYLYAWFFIPLDVQNFSLRAFLLNTTQIMILWSGFWYYSGQKAILVVKGSVVSVSWA